jgi:hypothetical protein
MATKYAGSNNTNWSAQSWLDGPTGSTTTAPGPADTVELNGKTVRLDVSITVASIINALGGQVTCVYHSNDRTITAQIIGASSTTPLAVNQSAGTVAVIGNLVDVSGSSTYVVSLSPSTGATVLITGNITSSVSTSTQMMRVDGNGIVSINGNVAGTRPGIYLVSSATFNLTGNITAGSAVGYAYGLDVHSSYTGSVVVTGNVLGGSTSQSAGIRFEPPRSLTIVGNVTAGSQSTTNGLSLTHASCSVSITGDVSGSTGSYAYGISAAGVVSVTGHVIGGSGLESHGIVVGNATVTINGNVDPGTGSTTAGVYCNASGILVVNGIVTGGTFGPGNPGGTQRWGIINAGSTVKVLAVRNGPYGWAPINGPFFFLDNATNCQYLGKKADLTTVTLTNPAASADYPSAANVRSGTSYAAGNLTGTCHVPAAGSVALGVAVDNTTGTAVLTEANVVAAISGNGPYTVTIRAVDDAGEPIQGARVVLSRSGQTRSGDTDADGESLLGCVAATWTVMIEASGFVFAPTTLAVSANTEQEYELSAIALEVSEPGKVTGYAYVYDSAGALNPGQEVSIKTVRSTVSSGVYAGVVRTVAANASGLAQFPNLFPGNTYAVKYGDGDWFNVDIPSTATVSHPIGRAIGPE